MTRIALDQVETMVLAGGRGTRLAHVLSHLPKPLAPVAGRPFIEWIVRNLRQAGLRRIIISTGHLAEAIEAHFARRPVPDCDVRCIREPQPLGTGGAILYTAAQLGWSPPAWLILNGDSLLFVDWRSFVARLDRVELDGVIVGRGVDDTSRYGRLTVSPSNRLLSFSEKATMSAGPGMINGGIYLLRPGLFAEAGAAVTKNLSLELDLFPAWLAAGRQFEVYPVETEFLDIGTEETLSQADAFILRHQNRFL